jgi:Pyridoxamine 5'-phosphate oxidase
MAIATRSEKQEVTPATTGHATTEQVWQAIEKASFAVVGYVTPSGDARSSGVVYKTVGKRLYFAVAPDSWKARHIAASKRVSVTVPVHRGGILALVAPIPPATISFHAEGIVHPAGSVKIDSLSKELESLLPRERRDNAVLIELIPEGRFLTYGVGVSLTDMQRPERAEAVVPVAG